MSHSKNNNKEIAFLQGAMIALFAMQLICVGIAVTLGVAYKTWWSFVILFAPFALFIVMLAVFSMIVLIKTFKKSRNGGDTEND